MIRALVSIDVWQDSGPSAVITVCQDRRRIDRVTVIPGDTFDLELGEGMHAVVGMLPGLEEAAAEFEAQGAALRAELEGAA